MTYFLSDYSTAEFAEKVSVRTYAKRDGRVVSSHRRKKSSFEQRTDTARKVLRGVTTAAVLGGLGYIALSNRRFDNAFRKAKTYTETIAPLTRPKYRGMSMTRTIRQKLPQLKEQFGAVVTPEGRVSLFDASYDIADEQFRNNIQAALKLPKEQRRMFGQGLRIETIQTIQNHSNQFRRSSLNELSNEFGLNLTTMDHIALIRDSTDFYSNYLGKHAIQITDAMMDSDPTELRRLAQIWGANTNQRRLSN